MNKLWAGILALLIATPTLAAFDQTVPGVIVGFDSGPITVSNTPSNTSHTTGVGVGGVFQVPIARVNGGSGIITSLLLKDTNGSAQSYILRMWSRNPVNTNCTDGNFTGSNIDDQYLIGSGPIFIQTATTTGDSYVYGSLTGLTWSYHNTDSSPTTYVYICLVTTGTYTPAAGKPIYLTLSGPQN